MTETLPPLGSDIEAGPNRSLRQPRLNLRAHPRLIGWRRACGTTKTPRPS